MGRRRPKHEVALGGTLLAAALLLAAPAPAQHLHPSERDTASAPVPVYGSALGQGAPLPAGGSEEEIRGLVEARNETVLSSQIEGRILRLRFEPGEAFRNGDALVEFDCAMHQARLAAARAGLRGARKTHENNQELARLGAISTLDVELSEAEVEKRTAEVEVAQVHVSRCTIRAPYDGRVVERVVNEHESVSANQELLRILDDSRLEIVLIVPSAWLTWLEPGAPFEFRVDETGRSYPAAVARVGARVDPVSQTVRLEAVFPGDPNDVLAGMSGAAHFERTSPAAAAR
jgi:RND family efflux transporter MFP subunit